jgi:hypothetical protein
MSLLDDYECIRLSFKLFDDLKCGIYDGPSVDKEYSDVTCNDAELTLLSEDKMRCHIINCLVALQCVLRLKSGRLFSNCEKYGSVKRKVFAAAISMILHEEIDRDRKDVEMVLSNFPDENMISNGQSWLPIQFAVALTVENEISDDDVHILLSGNPEAVEEEEVGDEEGGKNEEEEEDGENEEEEDDEDDEEEVEVEEEGGENQEDCVAVEISLTNCTPVQILCMQKQPNLPLLEYFYLYNPKAISLCDRSSRNVLHVIAQYSESLELLQYMLPKCCEMTKLQSVEKVTPLGLLCRRLEFPAFDKMASCLIEADNSVAVIYDGVINCIKSYEECLHQDISPGSRGEKGLTLLGKLLDANPNVSKHDDSDIFHEACNNLRGELGIAVLSLFHTKDSTGVRTVRDRCLPIDYAASSSCVEVLKFLHKVYPESISMLNDRSGKNLLHKIISDDTSDIEDVKAKVQYVCAQCPALIALTDNDGFTAFHELLTKQRFQVFNLDCIKMLCNADETVVRQKCTPLHFDTYVMGQLALHRFICSRFEIPEVSDEGDCLRLLLYLYPAAAGIKDHLNRSPYDMAVSNNLSTYFIRLLLRADPTINPGRLCDLNFAARREGIFLAFRALSSDLQPTIWKKLHLKGSDLIQCVLSYL